MRPTGCAARTATALDAAIAAWTRTLPAKAAEAILEAAEVPCSRLFDIADCAADPHFRRAAGGAGGGRSADWPHPASRAGDPAGRERPEDVVRWTGPAVGAHTEVRAAYAAGVAEGVVAKGALRQAVGAVSGRDIGLKRPLVRCSKLVAARRPSPAWHGSAARNALIHVNEPATRCQQNRHVGARHQGWR